MSGRILKWTAAAAALVLVFVTTWIALDRTERRPRWLKVRAPESAFVGRPLEIRVTLAKSVGETLINCSLHRSGAKETEGHFLASSGPSRRAAGGETRSFVFEVPDHEDMIHVFALIYLSPTGRWPEATQAVSTGYMTVRRDGAGADGRRLKKIRIYHYRTEAEPVRAKRPGWRPRRRPSPWVHPVIAAFLLAGAALCAVKAGRRDAAGDPAESKERTVWLVFAAVLALGAVVEVSGMMQLLASWGRRLAEDMNVYEDRKPFQEAIMAAMAAASLGLFFLFMKAIRRPGPHRYLWWAGIGLAAYLAVSVVSALSFHAVDVFRRRTWHGVSPVDLLRCAGTLVVLLAAALSLRRKDGRRLT